MVGMSGKSGETRRTGAGVVTPNKKLDHQPQQQNAKPKVSHVTYCVRLSFCCCVFQPSAEQVNIARILGDTDTTPADMVDRISKVMAVVSSKSEEEVTIALHDNDYCVEKAIETLLDSAGDVTVRERNKRSTCTSVSGGDCDGVVCGDGDCDGVVCGGGDCDGVVVRTVVVGTVMVW